MGSYLVLITDSIKNSLAPTTWPRYQSAWLLWLSFLNSLQEPSDSFSEGFVLLLLNFLFCKHYSWAYVLEIKLFYVWV